VLVTTKDELDVRPHQDPNLSKLMQMHYNNALTYGSPRSITASAKYRF
jgi:hypothetical protein